MNIKKNKNILIILFVLILLYFVTKKNLNEENKSDSELENSLIESKESALKKEPYLYDWKQKGDKGEVVKLIQKRFFMTLKMLSNYFKNSEYYEYDTWQHDIFNLYKHNYENFKIDGIWGEKTSLVSKVITGNSGSSLFVARKKYLDIKSIIYKN